MRATPALGLFVFVVVAAAVGGIVWLAARGMGKDQELAREIDRTVMADYCRLVAAGQPARAWETCLAESYRKEVSRDAFVAAHGKRRAEKGALASATLLRASLHRNLFSRTRELQLLYELAYPGGVETQYVTVNDADGAWRIEGTYHLGAGDTLDYLLW